MKATTIAKFINVLVVQQVQFSIDEIHGKTYEEAFKASHHLIDTNSLMADGLYITIWTCKESFLDDIVSESIAQFLPEIIVKNVTFDASCEDIDMEERLYIIKIED